jgi:HNH endonuclease
MNYEQVKIRHVKRAIAECDRLGEQQFLEKYEFGKPTVYYLVDEGRPYPPKAIAGVANGYASGTFLTGSTSMGGWSGANKLFKRLDLPVLTIADFRKLSLSSGFGQIDVHSTLEKLSHDFPDFVPDNIVDARVMELRNIAARQGQAAFRKRLMKAYRGACAITKTKISGILQAAHIIPFMGNQTNHVQNGILLRSDIHDLFDQGLINIDPKDYIVKLSRELKESEYAKYEGIRLNLPEIVNARPSKDALQLRFYHK